MNIKRKLLFIFFLTGATGLIYQILWARILGTIFGNSMYAISTVLASFMGGLALGSRYFGKLIDNNKINLLQSFSKIQLAIGLYAALTPLIFSGVHKIYGIVGSTQINFFTTFLIFIVCFVIILIPTTLMGGTLPILSKYFTQEKTRENDSADFSIARLYAVNTLGAVLGAFLTAYFMVRIIGVRGTIYFSVIINLLVAYYVNSLNKKTGPVFSHIKEKMPSSSASALLLIIVGISGLTTFVYEITWTRILSMVLGSSVYAYATMLCAFLTGISLGSFIFAKFSRRYGFKDIKKKLITFGYIQAGIGISVLLLIPVFGVLPLVFLRIFKMTGQGFFGFQAVQFLLAFSVMIVPTTLFGTTLPLACSIYNKGKGNPEKSDYGIGETVGNIYASDTIGAIAGTLLAGFLLVPLIGIQSTIIIIALVNIALAVILLSLGLRKSRLKRGLIISFLLFFSISYGFAVPEWNKKLVTSGVYQYAAEYIVESSFQPQNETQIWKSKMERKDILFYEEGRHFTVSIQKHPETGVVALTIDGKADASSDYSGDMRTQIISGHLPMMLAKEPEKVLIVGLASGVTLGTVTKWPGVKEIDCVEIEPAMVQASSFFNEWNNKPLQDPRVNLILNDARNYLMTTEKEYDVIISEPSNPWISGSAPLFTKEYYNLVKSKLTENGVFCGWMQMYNITPEDYKVVYNTVKRVFPYTSLWRVTSGDTLLISTPEKLNIDLNVFEKYYENFRDDFSKINVNSVFELLTKFLGFPDFEKTRINTDNRPLIEFSAARNLYNWYSFEDVSGMLEKHQQSISAYIDEFTLHYELGDAYLEEGKYSPAYYELIRAAEYERKRAESYNLLGYIEILRGEIASAKNYLNKAIELDPDYTAAYINLSHAYYNEGFPVEALDILRKTIDLDPESALAYHNIGNIYYAQGYYQRALDELKKAVKYDPDFANSYLHMGIIYFEKQNMLEKAKEKVLKALEIKEDYADAYYHLGRIYMASGEKEKAKEAFDMAVSLNPEFIRVLENEYAVNEASK